MPIITITELNTIDWQSAKYAPTLTQDDVQVWRVRLPEVEWDIKNQISELSIAEKDRALRFVQPDDALRYIVAHKTLRQLLSQLTGVAPHKLAFTKNEFSKPALALHHNIANVHFNLSHSGQYVIISLSKHPVGVDVEYVKNDFNFGSLLLHYFTTTEAQSITRSLSPVDAFFKAWTRKEALGKGLGSGVTENMQKLPCVNGLHHSNGLVVVNDWTVRTFGVDDGHVASLAGSNNAEAIRFFDYIL